MIYYLATHLELMRHRHRRAAGRGEGFGEAWVATIQRLHSSLPQTLQPQQQALKSTKTDFVEFDWVWARTFIRRPVHRALILLMGYSTVAVPYILASSSDPA